MSVKEYFYSVMAGSSSGIFAGIVGFFLYGASLFYGLVIACRNFFYDCGIFKKVKVSSHVVSVGNITLGGTGKTPFVIYLAENLSGIGKKPAVITRGYGEDEKIMLKENLRVPVFAGPEKSLNAKVISDKKIADTIILDDGFQHRRLARDLDIVLIDSSNPFGNMHLFPRGVLRESISSLKRADAVVFTKTDFLNADINILKEKIKSIKNNLIFAEAVYKITSIFDVSAGVELEPSFLKGKKFVLISAIANTGYFKKVAEFSGVATVGEFKFMDHYDYKADDLEAAFKDASEKNAGVLTTEKDFVKIKKLIGPNVPKIYVMKIKFELREGKDVFFARLRSIYSSNNN